MTPAALEQAWAENGEKVLAVALRLTHGDEQAAEDLRADTFARAARAYFRGDSSVWTWLYAILRSVFLDARRRAARRPTSPLEYEPEARGRAPLDVVADDEAVALIRAEVNRLPLRLRDAMDLRCFHDASYDEIAAETRLAIGTIKSRLHHARREVRAALEVRLAFAGAMPRA